MPTGRIESWIHRKGYGFVRSDEPDGGVTFIHVSRLDKAGIPFPEIGMRLSYATELHEGRRRVTHCWLLND